MVGGPPEWPACELSGEQGSGQTEAELKALAEDGVRALDGGPALAAAGRTALGGGDRSAGGGHSCPAGPSRTAEVPVPGGGQTLDVVEGGAHRSY